MFLGGLLFSERKWRRSGPEKKGGGAVLGVVEGREAVIRMREE